jgi:hypothetical protein
MFEVPLKKTIDSDKFRQPALFFEKHNTYLFAPPGTTEYMQHWSQESEYCKHGFTAEDGDWIPGYFYFYLNYSRIILVKDVEIKMPTGKVIRKKERVESFPNFWDYDRAYYEAVELAEQNHCHLAVIKARGKGYSFKGASMLVRNFYMFRESLSVAIASGTEFLSKDGILSKAWDMMDFLDNNTAWFKHRQVKNSTLYRRASFIEMVNGVPTEQGYKSEIMGVSLNNDPQKARGKRAKLILFEEAGKFPNLKTAWQVARPSVEEDGEAFGLMIAFGTGGTQEADYTGLKSLWYEPIAYNCLPLRNIWDEGAQDTEGGFFIPQSANMKQFMDSDGNTDFEASTAFILAEREKIIEHASDKSSIDRHICEQPLTPGEATLNISTNIFPKKDMIRHLADIRNSESIKGIKQVGSLYFDSKGFVKFEQDPTLKDLTKYKLQAGDSKEGAVVIWEHPIKDPPWGLYIGGCDPYDHDSSQTDSLGSVFIFKRIFAMDTWSDTLVAEYTGRPESADSFYEIVRMLVMYYSATLLYENEKKGLFTYFANKHCEYLLADQPTKLKDIVKDMSVSRGKGTHMNVQIKQYDDGLINKYLRFEYEPGKKSLLKINSEPLLEELIAYDPNHGNFDRVIAFGLCLLYREELYNISTKKLTDEERVSMYLFPKPLFLNKVPNYNNRYGK